MDCDCEISAIANALNMAAIFIDDKPSNALAENCAHVYPVPSSFLSSKFQLVLLY